jgi:hypothetical protein
MKECTKAVWEMTKTPKFQAALGAYVAEANRDITHAEFVAGVLGGEIGFKCMVGEPYRLIKGARRVIFNTLVFLYVGAPFMLVPLWAWHQHDWWLLLGSAIPLIAAFLTTFAHSAAGFILLAFLASWIFYGFHAHATFFLLCALWGAMLFLMADNAQNEYAMGSLLEDPELFKQAIAQNKIMIVHKD